MAIRETTTIRERFRRARGEKPLIEVARLSGVSRDYPRQLETGQLKDPGVATIAKIARGLGVRAEWLAYGSGRMQRKAATTSEAQESDQ